MFQSYQFSGKAQIHFSNRLENLIPILKGNVFPEGSKPFEKKLIVVPHVKWKEYLMDVFARDSLFQIAAGFQIVLLPQAFSLLTKNNLPSFLELSLFIQHALNPLIEEVDELKHYFSSEHAQIGPFCDLLATYFSRYAVFGRGELKSWQKQIWDSLKWTFPESIPVPFHTPYQIHLFGFPHLPRSYFEIFKRLDGQFYFYSPCAIFWEDFYSDKESNFLKIEDEISDQNPLLRNWGRVGRYLQQATEESALPAFDHYSENASETSLSSLQNALLSGMNDNIPIDDSIQIHSAPTKWREVEILKQNIYKLFESQNVVPKDIQVFAPNIGDYAPYIGAVFTDVAYEISDLQLCEVDPLTRGFSKFLELPKKRFAVDEVLQVLPLLKNVELDIGKISEWVKAAHIRWGFSKEQRKKFYKQDLSEKMVTTNTEEGTWDRGLNRLLLGFAHSEGQGEPLPAVSITEMESFNALYTSIHSLVDDLEPLYDGTKWTISTWLRYFAALFESYFLPESTHDLYKDLIHLASSCDLLVEREFAYPDIERVVQSLMQKKKTQSAPHLQAIRFASLSEGCALPGKVICLLGMDEESFPRKEEGSSLCTQERDYRPRQTDIDRYSFLQIVSLAQEYVVTSYVRSEDGKRGISPLLDDLMGYISGSKIIHHPISGDLGQFQKNETSINLSPLIPNFYETVDLSLPNRVLTEIDIQKLFKFARHPLRYYFNTVLGIYPEGPSSNSEYLLSPFLKQEFVKKGLHRPLEAVFEEAQKQDLLPTNLLRPLAKKQVEREVDEWEKALAKFGIKKEELERKIINCACDSTRITGTIENFTSKGLLIYGENTLEDRIRFWPQALLMRQLELPLLFVKDQTRFYLDKEIGKYLEYFSLAHSHPSPLTPQLAKAFLQGNEHDLKKSLHAQDDPIWNWLFFRDPPPSSSAIIHNWQDYLVELFRGVDEHI